MKRRLVLLAGTVMVVAALALPSSSLAASGNSFKIVSQHCIAGGHNVYFRVSGTATGSSYATKLTIKSTSQYFSGGTWHASYHWQVDKLKFTRNGQSHTIDYSYSHTDNSSPYKWRIVSVLKALEGKHYLDGKTLTSKPC